MKYRFYILLGILLAISSSSISKNRIQINIPTPDSETEYVWSIIQDTPFFEKNNYQVSLPEGALIESLINKSKKGKLSDFDYQNLREFMKGAYNPSDYEAAHDKIKNNIDLINSMIAQFSKFKFDWEFKEFEVYQVNLTLYGPGGSYNADEGSLLLYTTPKGRFKQYDNPANTIIHEIVHIGIDQSIINKYKVPHALKERIVDTFVYLNFKDLLLGYTIQNMGDNRIDPHLKNKSDLNNLNNFVQQIMNEEK